jgi:hypothetical protein
MINWKECGSNRVWPTLRYYPGILLGGTEEDHEKASIELPASRPKCGPVTSRIRSRNVNDSTTTFGGSYFNVHSSVYFYASPPFQSQTVIRIFALVNHFTPLK